MDIVRRVAILRSEASHRGLMCVRRVDVRLTLLWGMWTGSWRMVRLDLHRSRSRNNLALRLHLQLILVLLMTVMCVFLGELKLRLLSLLAMK